MKIKTSTKAILINTLLITLVLMSCNRPAPRQTSDITTSKTATYTCRGTEPFWMVKIEMHQITFLTPEEEMIYPAVPAQKAGNVVSFETKNSNAGDENSILKIRIWPEPCTDSMSDEAFSFTVEIERDGKTYHGCATRDL